MEWAAERPRGRHDLSGGQMVAGAPEGLAHTRLKYEVTVALRTATAGRGLGCAAIGGGVIETRIVHDGTLTLAPPGLGIAVPTLFGAP